MPPAGPLREQERDEAAQLFMWAFPTHTRDSLYATPLDQIFAVRDGGKLLLVTRWDLDEVAAAGAFLPVAVRTAITVRPGYRGRHAGDQRREPLLTMLREFLATVRDQGCVLVGAQTHLFPMAHDFGFGWASATRRYLTSPDNLRLTSMPTAGHLDMSPAAMDLYAVAQAAARRRFGLLRRRPEHWADWLVAVADDRHQGGVAWRGDAGEPEGYLLYRSVVSAPDLMARSGRLDMVVEEFVALTPDAYLGLLDFLSGQTTAFTFRWDAPADDPLAAALWNPRQVLPEVRPDKLLRIANLAELTLPAEGVDIGQVEGLRLAVNDPIAEWNSGQWQAVADGSRFRLERVASSDRPTCSLSVTALAPLLSGHLQVDQAWACGLVRDADSHGRAQLRALFPPRPAPYCPQPW